MKMEGSFSLLLDYLSHRSAISVPDMQHIFRMSYGEARTTVTELVRANVLLPPTKQLPLFFEVVAEHAKRRALSTKEIEQLVNGFSSDEHSAMGVMCNCFSSTFAEMENVVHGEDDTQKALEQLIARQLIYKYENAYYSLLDADSGQRLLTAMRGKKSATKFQSFRSFIEDNDD